MLRNVMNKGRDPQHLKLDESLLQEKSYRGDRLVDKWAKVPEIGEGLLNLPESVARDTAFKLENQARFFSRSRMNEAQISAQFQGLSPENMLRLIRLVNPNEVRSKLFTEFKYCGLLAA